METLKNKHFVAGVFIFLVLVLAVFFHFEIHFENALTNLPEADYGVHISTWRYIFEPILGPLLFYNRSINPLTELPLALLWLCVLYVLISIIRVYKYRNDRKEALLKKLANIPLVLGIGFSIFVVILFIPLPNNSIVNNSENSVLVTTHAHTEYSHDGLISQKAMWKWHRRNGFDAFFITDHANHKKSLQFSKLQKNGGLDIAPLILVGQEHSGTNHMSLLGLNGKFDTKGMADKAVVDSVHKYGGAVFVNHWFDLKGKEKEYYRQLGVDGFEIENVGNELYYDREIYKKLKKYCLENNLIMVGGLDFHGYGRACSLYNALEIPDWKSLEVEEKEQSILNILKNGPQRKIKVLMYRDRDFYTNKNWVIRPFFTFINYFRTLNFIQVFSWFFWVAIFQFCRKPLKVEILNHDNSIVILTGLCVIFLWLLSGVFYFKGEAVKGYSEVYTEYFLILVTVGGILTGFVLFLGHKRFFKKAI
jgi:hypothetical protein